MNKGFLRGKARPVKVTYIDGSTKTVEAKHFHKKKKSRNWYLKTDHWKVMRSAAKSRDNYKCVECESTAKLEVHHLTYENIGKERLEDLITLCQPCHVRADRLRRSTGVA